MNLLHQMDICMIVILYQLILTTGIPCTKNKKYHTIKTFLKSTRKVVETKAIKSGSVKLFFILLLKYTSFFVPNTVQSIYFIRLFDCTFGSSLPPIVCRRAHVLFPICVLVRVKWCPTHIVFCFLFVFFFSSSFLVSLDCPFLIAPTRGGSRTSSQGVRTLKNCAERRVARKCLGYFV